MVRGTTPTHRFGLPVSASLISRLRLIYIQNNQIVLKKTESDMTVEDDTWSVKLTQEETFLFAAGIAEVKFRGKTIGGDVLSNDPEKPIRFVVFDSGDDEVL